MLPVVVCAPAVAVMKARAAAAPAASHRVVVRSVSGRDVIRTSFVMLPSLPHGSYGASNISDGSGRRPLPASGGSSLGRRRSRSRQRQAAGSANDERRFQPLVPTCVLVLAID